MACSNMVLYSKGKPTRLKTDLRVGGKMRAFRIQDLDTDDWSFVLQLYLLGKDCQDSIGLSVFKQLWNSERQHQDKPAVGADPESWGGGGCVLYEGAGEV